jgi:hypothetical protein
MKEVIYLELNALTGALFLFFALSHQVIVSSLDQSKIRVSIEEVVLLEQHGIGSLLGLIERFNSFKVAILKFLLLEFLKDHILFLQFSEAKHKDLEVLFNFSRSLSFYFSSDRLNIGEVMLSNALDKS